jgi:hypothetical protein
LYYLNVEDELKKIGYAEGDYFIYAEIDVSWNYVSNSNGSDWDMDFDVDEMRFYKVKEDKYD